MIQLFGIGIIATVLFFIQQHIYKNLWNKHLNVSLSFTTPEIFEGDIGYLQEIITNRKRLPLPMLKVKFQTNRNLLFEDSECAKTTDQYYRNDVFQINGGEKITRTLSFVGDKRGYYQIDSIDLVATDLFMATQMYSELKTLQDIYVYPKPFHSNAFKRSLQQINGEVLSKRHLLEDPFEYRGIREYQPYDDMKSVNWKATAKTDELKVNQKNYTALKAVRIFMNLEDTGILKKTDCVEACIQIAAGLAQFFLSQGMLVSCYCNGVDIINEQPLILKARAGTGQLKNLYRSLARIDTEKPVVNFCDNFGETLLTEAGQLMTFIVSPNHYDDFVSLLEQYKSSGNDFVWFYPVDDSIIPTLPETLVSNSNIIHIQN